MNKAEIRNAIKREAHKLLARDSLYAYATAIRPDFYTKERGYLRVMCDTIEHFIYGQNEKRFLLISVPPRFGKSLTARTTTEWLFGHDQQLKVMTGSYNETLSTSFSQAVRDTIQMEELGDRISYRDIFPNTRVQVGDAKANMWSLEGATGKSYLATSPTGTATGFGANIIVVDDIIKNDKEALNERILEEKWQWFNNTMLQRLEGDWRVIVIMTRWAKRDLAGMIAEKFPNESEIISMPAINEQGEMLCESILSKRDYEMRTQEMFRPIAEAIYLQKPIDAHGQLYPQLNEYDFLPKAEDARDERIFAMVDTADTGSDYLCALVYRVINGDVYILDALFTQDDMNKTESQLADLFFTNGVNEAEFEANNGGRLFSENIKRALRETYNSTRCVITTKTQTANKESRILTSSAWVRNHIYFPRNWQGRWRDLHSNIINYQTKGKNEHDDAVDVLAGIYEKTTGKGAPVVYNKNSILNANPYFGAFR